MAEDANGEPVELHCTESVPTAAYVFKTVADPFVGKLSSLRVISGKVTAGLALTNARTGDIMGDVTKRRGRVLGMEPDEDGMQTIIAEVPLAELANFTTFIRQITQGRGWFTTEFARYEILPEMLVPAVVEQAKKLGNLDEGAEDCTTPSRIRSTALLIGEPG